MPDETNTNVDPTSATQAGETAGAAVKAPEKLADVRTMYFPPDEKSLTAFGNIVTSIMNNAAMQAAMQKAGHQVRFNFDPSAGMPAQTGGYILPIGSHVDKVKTDKDGNLLFDAAGNKLYEMDGNKRAQERQVDFIVIAALPTIEAVNATADGQAFVEAALRDKFAAKIRNAYMGSKKVSADDVKLPTTVAEFIEKGEKGIADQGLSTFRDMADNLVKLLKDSKKLDIKKDILRQVFQSAAFAKALYPGVSQVFWANYITMAKNYAEANNMASTVYVKWLETRDQAGASDVVLSDDEALPVFGATATDEPAATVAPAPAT